MVDKAGWDDAYNEIRSLDYDDYLIYYDCTARMLEALGDDEARILRWAGIGCNIWQKTTIS